MELKESLVKASTLALDRSAMNPFNGIESTPSAPGLTLARLRIHSMDLKAPMWVSTITFLSESLESIQWNWKYVPLQGLHENCFNIPGNPFNGIERDTAGQEGSAGEPRRGNPFNGIESSNTHRHHLLARLEENPFNGIESRKINLAVTLKQLRRIHLMELKGWAI